MNLQKLWLTCVERGASDLHLSSGVPAMLRIDGDLVPCGDRVLSDEDIQQVLKSCCHAVPHVPWRETFECDFSFDVSGVARFRVNVFHQARGVSAVFRLIPHRVPTLQALQAPGILFEMAQRARGLVLVTGSTGSGKSTTLAALVNALNLTQFKHIVTIEDPIEFVHTSNRCLVQQRELGVHTLSFANALRAALREDPDVILVGELRDAETIRIALTAAETGHLVLATLHTQGAAKTMDRLIDVFAAEEKDAVRSLLSESLSAVVSQVLCKRKEGQGRMAAYEVLVATPAVRHLIREGKVAQMYSAMQTGQALGMQTLDQSLADLLRQGKIDELEAHQHAKYPESLASATDRT